MKRLPSFLKTFIHLFFKSLRFLPRTLSFIPTFNFFFKKQLPFYKTPAHLLKTRVSFKGVPCYKITEKEISSKKMILYLHGGAFVFGLNSFYFKFLETLYNHFKIPLLLVDYRLAPSHPFPAALNDCFKVYSHLLEAGYSPENIFFMGDSAGGNLVLSLLLYLKQKDSLLPKAALLLSPWLDLSLTGMELNLTEDPLIFKEFMPPIIKAYVPKKFSPNHPLISPLYGNFKGLPPCFIYGGTREILLKDILKLIRKMRHQGVKVKTSIGKGMEHVHPLFYPNDPESQALLKKMQKFIEEIGVNS